MRYETPTSSKEAATLLSKEKGHGFILAGGTDLLVKMRTGLVEPDLVVDIKHIPAMTEIKESKTAFKIGSAVPSVRLSEHKALKKSWPGVVEAAGLIGSDQIQGRCTVVGNLCNASPAADSVPALVAAGAKAVIVGASKRRTVAVEEIMVGPGKTSLNKGEVIEAITLPKPARKTGDAYLRFTPRSEMDIAVVGVSISMTLERGKIKKAKVCLGAVGPTPIVVAEAAKAIVGTKLDDEALEALAGACSKACRPIDDKRGTAAYRIRVAGVLAKRAAKIAFERAGG